MRYSQNTRVNKVNPGGWLAGQDHLHGPDGPTLGIRLCRGWRGHYAAGRVHRWAGWQLARCGYRGMAVDLVRCR